MDGALASRSDAALPLQHSVATRLRPVRAITVALGSGAVAAGAARSSATAEPGHRGGGRHGAVALESIRAALDAGVDTFIREVRLVKATLDGVRQDVELVRRLIG